MSMFRYCIDIKTKRQNTSTYRTTGVVLYVKYMLPFAVNKRRQTTYRLPPSISSILQQDI